MSVPGDRQLVFQPRLVADDRLLIEGHENDPRPIQNLATVPQTIEGYGTFEDAQTAGVRYLSKRGWGGLKYAFEVVTLSYEVRLGLC